MNYINLTDKKISINGTVLNPATLVPTVESKVAELAIDGDLKLSTVVWGDIIGLPRDQNPNNLQIVDESVAMVAKRQNVVSIKTSELVDGVVVVTELQHF